MSQWKNKLYFGDNFTILKEHIVAESIDLVYLDPPFNSNASYNVLFKEQTGEQSTAQISAFDDTWHWGQESENTFRELVTTYPKKLADLIQAYHSFLGTSDMMAYLVMMAPRLYELHRVLKSTGSIYLHCDPTASHYLKLLLDAIFGADNFVNEIIWGYRTGGASKRQFSRKHDIIFFYSKSNNYRFNTQYYKSWQQKRYNYSEKYPEYFDEDEKRWYHLSLCRDVWEDINVIGTENKERLGYPTQKPEALLERIIKASSNEGDIVLDPFCGCGTAVAVAENFNRRWIGIDITHLAITLIRHRIDDGFNKQDLAPYEVIGDPKDLASASALAKENRYQFEWWALGLVDARPAQDKKKGADQGVDGYIYFFDDNSGKAKKIIIQVKSGHVTVNQIRDLKGVLDREKASIGVFITLQKPTKPMQTEAITAGFYEPEHFEGKHQRLQILTIEEILNGKEVSHPRGGATATFKKAKRKDKNGNTSIQLMML